MSDDRKKVEDSVVLNTFDWRGPLEEFQRLLVKTVERAEAKGMESLEVVLKTREAYYDSDSCTNAVLKVIGIRNETDQEQKERRRKEKVDLEEAHLLHFGKMVEWAHESVRLGTAKIEEFEVEFICLKCREFNLLRELKEDDVAVRVMLPCVKCIGKVTENMPSLLFKGERV